MDSQFAKVGEYAFNWDNIQYVKRTAQRSGGYTYTVYFVGRESVLNFYADSDEGKAIHNWWENQVPELTDGTEPIGIA